jgi:hypothetical protein
MSTRLHGVTFQKIVLFVVTGVRTSNLTYTILIGKLQEARTTLEMSDMEE